MEADYHIRKYLAYSLEKFAKRIATSHAHYRNTNFQLALCYYLGFGVSRSVEKAQSWLKESGRPIEDLENHVECIRACKAWRLYRSDEIMLIAEQGYFNGHILSRRYHETWIPEKQALTNEVEDLASVLGKDHDIVHQLQSSLSSKYQQAGLLKDAEAMQIEEILSLLNESQAARFQHNLDSLKAATTHNLGQKQTSILLGVPQLVETSPIPNSPDSFTGNTRRGMARAMNNLVNTWMLQFRWVEAEWLCVQARDILTQDCDKKHLNSLRYSVKIARIYRAQGRLEEAVRIYLCALDLCRDSLGEEHWQTLEISTDLAVLYQREHYHWEDVEKLLMPDSKVRLKKIRLDGTHCYNGLKDSATLEEQYLDVGKNMLVSGRPNKSVIFGIRSLIAGHHRQKHFKEAEDLLQQLIEICKKVLPKDDPETLSQIGLLGRLWEDQGRNSEAESILREAYEKTGCTLGETHAATLEAANNLAVIYLRQKRFPEGEVLMQETIAAQKKVCGESHPNTLATSINLAALYKACGKQQAAIKLLEDSFEKQNPVPGEGHIVTFICLDHLAELYIEDKRYDDAEKVIRVLITRRQSALGPEHPEVLKSMLKLAKCFLAQKRWQEATPLVEQYNAVSTRVLGDTSIEALEGLLYLGLAHYQGERWEEGKKIYQIAVDRARPALGENHCLTKGLVARLEFGKLKC